MDGRGMGKSDWGRMKMDKKELIRKYNEKAEKEILNDNLSISRRVLFRNVVRELKKLELDEPQKVKIPKFVAEYMKKQRNCKESLRQAMHPLSLIKSGIAEWFEFYENQELFARAWLDGYEVIEELYILPVPYAEKDWYYRKFEGEFVLTMIGEYAYKFTESELDEYFPEIKKFAKRVEE